MGAGFTIGEEPDSSRVGLRARGFATALDKHRATITRWLNQDLRRERDDPTFQQRIDAFDRAISDYRHNATMRNVEPICDDHIFQQRLDDLDRAISGDRPDATMRNVEPLMAPTD